MKKIFVIYLLLITSTVFSQKTIIRGIALDSTKGRNSVLITLNDTVNKLVSDTTNNLQGLSKIWYNKKYVVNTDGRGNFKMKVKKTDTLAFQSYRHILKKIAVTDLLKLQPIKVILEPEVCETYVPCKDSFPSHYVFIGKKIKINHAKEKYYCNIISFDSKFDAEYKVVENIYGKLPNDVVKFVVYDHNGRPEFGKYETVMLFISRYCGELFHQKYQFYPLYKTEDNRLASPYNVFEYSRLDSTSTIKPEIIKFKEKVEIDIKGASQEYIEKWYPAPFYKIENGKAIAVYGNYVPELLELKKQTILKERKITLD